MPFFLPSQKERTRGIVPAQAGFGQVTVRAQIQAMTVPSVAGDLDFRVQVADPLLGLVAHPLAVAAYVFGQASRARPGLCLVGGTREDRGRARPLGRNLDQRLVDQYCDRVQVGGMCLQPEPLSLQRDRAAAGERVEDGRRIAAARLPDLLSGFLEQRLVVDVLPPDESPDDAV